MPGKLVDDGIMILHDQKELNIGKEFLPMLVFPAPTPRYCHSQSASIETGCAYLPVWPSGRWKCT